MSDTEIPANNPELKRQKGKKGANDKRSTTSRDNLAKARAIRLQQLAMQREGKPKKSKKSYDIESESESSEEEELIIRPSKKHVKYAPEKSKKHKMKVDPLSEKLDSLTQLMMMNLKLNKKEKREAQVPQQLAPVPVAPTPVPTPAPQPEPVQQKQPAYQDIVHAMRRKILLDL